VNAPDIRLTEGSGQLWLAFDAEATDFARCPPIARELSLDIRLGLRGTRVVRLSPIGTHLAGRAMDEVMIQSLRRAGALQGAGAGSDAEDGVLVASRSVLLNEGGIPTLTWLVALAEGAVLNPARIRGRLEGRPVTLTVEVPEGQRRGEGPPVPATSLRSLASPPIGHRPQPGGRERGQRPEAELRSRKRRARRSDDEDVGPVDRDAPGVPSLDVRQESTDQAGGRGIVEPPDVEIDSDAPLDELVRGRGDGLLSRLGGRTSTGTECEEHSDDHVTLDQLVARGTDADERTNARATPLRTARTRAETCVDGYCAATAVAHALNTERIGSRTDYTARAVQEAVTGGAGPAPWTYEHFIKAVRESRAAIAFFRPGY
jgi:hypothetical protein